MYYNKYIIGITSIFNDILFSYSLHLIGWCTCTTVPIPLEQ